MQLTIFKNAAINLACTYSLGGGQMFINNIIFIHLLVKQIQNIVLTLPLTIILTLTLNQTLTLTIMLYFRNNGWF